MASFNILLAFLLALFGENAGGVVSHFDLNSTNHLDGYVAINCSGAPREHEIIDRIIIRKLPLSSPTDSIMTFNIGNGLNSKYGNQMLYRPGFGRITSTYVTFKISNLGCDDVGVYRCDIEYRRGTTVRTETFNKKLMLFGLPKPPKIIVASTTNNEIKKNQIWANSTASFIATCRANVGFPWSGFIGWRVYQMCDSESITDYDFRIISQEDVSTQPLENINDKCTKRLEHKIALEFSSDIDYFKVMCFIMNGINGTRETPLFCHEPASELCAATETIQIFFTYNQEPSTSESRQEPQTVNASSIASIVVVIGILSFVVGTVLGVLCDNIVKKGVPLKRLTQKYNHREVKSGSSS